MEKPLNQRPFRDKEDGFWPWHREAEDWERGVKEFGRPMPSDHNQHEVRDWLDDAFKAGFEAGVRASTKKCAREEAYRMGAVLGELALVECDCRFCLTPLIFGAKAEGR